MFPLALLIRRGQQHADPRVRQRGGKHKAVEHQPEKATAICRQSIPTALQQRNGVRGKEQRFNELIADDCTFLGAIFQTLDRLSPAFGAVFGLFEKPLPKEAHGAVPAWKLGACANGWRRKARFADQYIQTGPIAEHVVREAHALVADADKIGRSQAPERSLLALAQLHARHTGEKRVAFESPEPHQEMRTAELIRIA